MSFYILATITALIWLWGCLAYYGARKQWSWKIRYGGTFLLAIAALSVAVAGYLSMTKADKRESVPASFAEAGLEGERWTSDQLPLAAAVTVRKLTMLRNDLEWVMSLRDKTRAKILADEATVVINAWQSQNPEQLEHYRDCLQAAMHLGVGIGAVLEDGKAGSEGWSDIPFKQALNRCGASRQVSPS